MTSRGLHPQRSIEYVIDWVAKEYHDKPLEQRIINTVLALNAAGYHPVADALQRLLQAQKPERADHDIP